jgi:hypothetical protein
MNKFTVIMQLFQLLRERKKYWMIPIIAVFVLIGFMLISAQGSIVAPLIYTLF